MRRLLPAAVAMALAAAGAGGAPPDRETPTMAFALTSSAFAANGAIPARHTCDGDDLSPPLAWSGVPATTRSLALIVDDPDAPDPAAPRLYALDVALPDFGEPTKA